MIKNIVICGGHFSPALAVIETLLKRNKYKIYYIGRKFSLEGDTAESLEYLVIQKLNIPFYSLYSSRYQRSFTKYSFFSLAKFPVSIIQSFYHLLKIKPDIVLSFGGYVALPICIVSWIMKIPIITHEQTHTLGLSNRIISKFAKVVCLSWSDTKNLPKKARVLVTGNPILSKKESDNNTPSVVAFGNKKLPLLYITGGSLGSRFINKLISGILLELSSQYRIIHQTGIANDEADYQMLNKKREFLPGSNRENYKLVKFIDPFDVAKILSKADLIIGRSGANTVTEVQTFAVPAIFIPLPWSADKEQELNAKILEQKGSAVVIYQAKLTEEIFLKTVEKIINSPNFYKKAIEGKKTLRIDASTQIADLIYKYC